MRISEYGSDSVWTSKNQMVSSSATQKSISSDQGKRIGITTVGDHAYIASYSNSSTEEDPVIKVGDYEVHVNKVDPNHATKIEMFALMSYMDDQGLTNNTGICSFGKMMTSAQQAQYNGFCSNIYNESEAWDIKRNWSAIINNAKQTFMIMPGTYKQAKDSENMLEFITKWLNRSKDTIKLKEVEYESLIPKKNKKLDIVPIEQTEEQEDLQIEMLTSNQIIAEMYNEEGEKNRHLIWTNEKGIFCKEAISKAGYDWMIPFGSKQEYEHISQYFNSLEINDLSPEMATENYWKEYLGVPLNILKS